MRSKSNLSPEILTKQNLQSKFSNFEDGLLNSQENEELPLGEILTTIQGDLANDATCDITKLDSQRSAGRNAGAIYGGSSVIGGPSNAFKSSLAGSSVGDSKG